MFLTGILVAVIVTIKLLVGAAIGLIVTAIIYRSRFRIVPAIRTAVFSAVAYLLISGLAGWADSHAAFQDGHRLDVAPWGEDLRLRNLIASNEVLLCVVGSVVTAVLLNIGFKKRKKPNLV
jgi:hypothetical protein